MGTGYTRNDVSNNIADGNIINAADLDGEFDAVESAFNSSTGHTHDGTSAEGGPITVVGPVQDLVVSATEVKPKTTNTLDLGTSALLYKDAYLQGNMYFRDTALKIVSSTDGQLDIDADVEVEITAPTLDIDASTAVTIDTTTLTITGSVNVVGDLDVDNININGNTISSTNTNGNITLAPNGTGEVDISKVDIASGEIDGTTIGANSAAAGTFTNLTSTGTSTHATVDINGGNIDGTTIGASSAAAITGTTITGTSFVTSGDMTFGDNDKAIFGAGSDLQIYHDASDSIINDNGAGSLKLQTGGSTKLEVTSTGIDVTGTVTADGLTVDGNAGIGTSSPNKSSSSTALTVNTGTAANYSALELSSGDTLNWHIKANNSDVYDVTAGSRNRIFYTNGSERMRIDSSGQMGLAGSTASFDTTGAVNGLQLYYETDTGVATVGSYSGGGGTALTFHTNSGGGASSEAMRIDSSGNVLVGTTANPDSAAIHITGGSITHSSTQINARPGSGNQYELVNRNGAGFDFYVNNASNLAMRIDSSGNVGIGTSSPVAKLQIKTQTNGNAAFQNSTSVSGGVKINAFNDAANASVPFEIDGSSLQFNIASVEKMRIDSNGNVGIGTSSPQKTLDVRGELAISNSTTSYWNLNRDDGDGSLTFTDTNVNERMRIDSSGNLLIAGTGTPTSSVGNLVLYNGTAPTGSATDGVILYAEDVSSSSELKVRDEAGNVTTLSPHNFDLIPEGPSEDMAWSYYSERDGKRINVDMLKAIRLLEQISGEKLVHMV